MADSRKPQAWAGWAVILLAAFLYSATLDTGLRPDELIGGDLITHQYAQVEARPSNAPGYPLYTMGGWVWFRLTRPLLDWILNPVQRLASYSTLWALLSLFVLYRLTLKATQGNWPVAALSTTFYATTYFFWFYSVTTEQYTSAIFQSLLMVWLAFKWDEAQTNGIPGDHYLLWLAVVVGTCLANLVTVLFILPPLLWFILSRRPDLIRRPQMMVRSTLLAGLPLVSYAYIYARGAAHPEWRGAGQWPSAWAWFVDFLTTQQGRDELAPGLTLNRFITAEYPALIWGELTWIVLAGGLVGLWWLGRRRALLIYGTLTIYVLFCWLDRFGNWFQVILPAYPLLVLGFATGLNALLWARNWPSETRKAGFRGLIVLGMVALVGYRLTISLPRADQSHPREDTGLDPGWAVLADQPLAHSIILSEHSEWLALQYLTSIWGANPPVDPRPVCQIHPPNTGDGSQPLASVPAIYITRRAAAADPTCLADWHRYAAGATLIQIQESPNTQVPASAQPLIYQFGPDLRLVAFEVGLSTKADSGNGKAPGQATDYEAHPLYSGPAWRLSLYWRADASMDVDYTVSVRPLQDGIPILDEDGAPLIQDHQPVWNNYPTSRWSPGEVVRDDYVLYMPGQHVPTGAQVVVYFRTGGGLENLAEVKLTLGP